ncbi:MAG: alpha-galactosidase [Ruminococcaceae bacterium]|nr:alpha-galactosidase [Oscillospiraceae bacterium]
MFEKLKSQILIGKALVNQNDFDGRAFSFDFKQDKNSIKGVLKAKCDIVMKSFEMECEKDFDDDDLFFANGYQAWTTTREFSKNDTFKGLIKAAGINKSLKHFAGLSGDYHFEKYGEEGKFHAYTYCYFREKGEKEIKLYGSRSERNGFTIFAVDMKNDKFVLKKDVDGLKLTAGQEYEIFDIAIIKGDMDEVMDKYFFDFVGCKKPAIDHLSGYTSWYNYFQDISEDIILRDLNGLDRASDEVNIFQVDDGYQQAVGDWLLIDEKKFPNGMKYIADEIHKKGYKAGIWLAPFSAQVSSKIANEHPDWLLTHNRNGKKMLGCQGWGGAYTLDIYNPEVRAYIKNVFDTVLNDWGFDMVKLDFLYSQCIEPRNGKTRGEIMCDGVDFLREVCGDKWILGCGVPLGACMGIFDACRISCDASKNWKFTLKGNLSVNTLVSSIRINCENPSSQNAIINTIFRNHLDGRAFCNDPDVFFLRDININYTMEQKLLHGKINSVCGNVLFVSDNAGDFDEERIGYLKEFFKDKDYKVTFAEYVGKEDIRLDFTENGEEKSLIFNLITGESNIREVL